MYIDWLEEDMKAGQKIRYNLMDVVETFKKEVNELKEHLQVKKLADSPIIAMIDNKPVHQDEYEALEKLAEKLKTANYKRQSKIEKLEDEVIQLNKFLNKKWN